MAVESTSTAGIYTPTFTGANSAEWGAAYVNRDGFDLVWRQKYLQDQMVAIEDDIRAIEKNSNLTDTEKMFSMQMAMNAWSAVSNLRTNILKSVADTLKSVARNVS